MKFLTNKLIDKIKMPTFFSGKNVFRKYKLELYKGEEQGKIVFFEKVKKEFVLTAALATMKKLNKAVEVDSEGYKHFKANKKDLDKLPGTVSFINRKMEDYVRQIKSQWKKKHTNWDLWKHEFSFIEFVEKEKGVYNITFELKIWVAGRA